MTELHKLFEDNQSVDGQTCVYGNIFGHLTQAERATK